MGISLVSIRSSGNAASAPVSSRRRLVSGRFARCWSVTDLYLVVLFAFFMLPRHEPPESHDFVFADAMPENTMASGIACES